MSDQFTRITMGGSPLPADSPVVGLLFGQSSSDDNRNTTNKEQEKLSTVVTITDAEDIDFRNFEQPIALHQTVYPQNQIVGWYRVVATTTDEASSSSSSPTDADLIQTQQLASLFNTTQNSSHNNYNPVFIFALLQVPMQQQPQPPPSESKSVTVDNDEQQPPEPPTEQQEEELPLQFFGLYENCLIHHPHWTLITDKAEQYAVERVLRERVIHENHHSSSNPSHTILTEKTREIATSIAALDLRLATIQTFLEQQQVSPTSSSVVLLPMLRDIQGLLCHAQFLASWETNTTTTTSFQNTTSSLYHPIDTLAKTVDHLHSYADKCKNIGNYHHQQQQQHPGGGTTTTTTRSAREKTTLVGRGAVAFGSDSTSGFAFPT
jgi:hypothetical protein